MNLYSLIIIHIILLMFLQMVKTPWFFLSLIRISITLIFHHKILSYLINLLYLLSHHLHHNIPDNQLAFENHLLISMTINAIKSIFFLSPFRLLLVKVIFLLILMTYPNIFLTIDYLHLTKLFQLPFLYPQNLNFFMKL